MQPEYLRYTALSAIVVNQQLYLQLYIYPNIQYSVRYSVESL